MIDHPKVNHCLPCKAILYTVKVTNYNSFLTKQQNSKLDFRFAAKQSISVQHFYNKYYTKKIYV